METGGGGKGPAGSFPQLQACCGSHGLCILGDRSADLGLATSGWKLRLPPSHPARGFSTSNRFALSFLSGLQGDRGVPPPSSPEEAGGTRWGEQSRLGVGWCPRRGKWGGGHLDRKEKPRASSAHLYRLGAVKECKTQLASRPETERFLLRPQHTWTGAGLRNTPGRGSLPVA